MFTINERFEYHNDNGNPELYDKKYDVFYPRIATDINRNVMAFDNFIDGIELFLEYHGNGMLNLNNVYFIETVFRKLTID